VIFQRLLVSGFFVVSAVVSGSALAGDPAAGEKQFKSKCAICHTVEQGKNKIGPSLFGVVGRKSGSIEGFKYSEANRAANLTWDEPTLDKYLTDPKALVKGTIMTFPGIKNDTERADVVAYLATVK
jgi:cytochrome c